MLIAISKVSVQRFFTSNEELLKRILATRIARRRSVDLSECVACQRKYQIEKDSVIEKSNRSPPYADT